MQSKTPDEFLLKRESHLFVEVGRKLNTPPPIGMSASQILPVMAELGKTDQVCTCTTPLLLVGEAILSTKNSMFSEGNSANSMYFKHPDEH